jgi:hypothetical protein
MIGENGRDATALRLSEEMHRDPAGESVAVHYIRAFSV